MVIISNGKGKKDRIVPLSPKILNLLRENYKSNKPKIYLFEGVLYSDRNLQLVLKQSLQTANITKPVTLHWLRHSYIGDRNNLRYIQELLGHNSSRTTEIHTLKH